jgi:N-methylhydantoinase B
MTVRGVPRGAVIADNGVVLTGELEVDSMLYVAAATGTARASGPVPAEVSSDWGPGYARLFGGVSYADVDVVGS